jgi:hypothetical protein
MKIIKSWDYSDSKEVRIPIGKFYEIDAPIFDQSFLEYGSRALDRDLKLKEILEKFV